MKYGYIGLGNLGGHLAASLIRKGFDVTVYWVSSYHENEPIFDPGGFSGF